MRIQLSSLSTLVLASAAIAVTAIATVPAAQAATVGSTNVTVPFSFTVGNTTLPAGEYTVQRDNNGNFIKLESRDGAQHFNWIASQTSATKDNVTLRFDERGGSHALQSIQFGRLATHELDSKRSGREAAVEIVPGQ